MLRPLPVLLLIGLLLVGCGDDNGGGPGLIVISDFEGSWVMTQYKATSADNPAVYVELIALGGAFEFDVDEAGGFEGRGFVPAEVAGSTVELPVQGNLELISQDTVLVTFTPEIPPFLTETRASFTWIGDTLSLYDPNAVFDFDGDQQLEPSIFEGTMVFNTGSYDRIIFTEDFQGHWEATSYTVTSKVEPMFSVDTIDSGATFEFEVDASGQAVGQAFIPAAFAGKDTTFSDIPAAFELIDQDSMMIEFTPEIPPFLTNTRGRFTLDGDDYTLTDSHTLFDFDGDMVPEPAIAVVEMERAGAGR
jgi:hypothetical protein